MLRLRRMGFEMGAWGTGNFDNDTACDWAHDFVESGDMAAIDSILSTVAKARDDGVDSNDACEALVASEVLARLLGHWGERNAYSGGIDEWVLAHPQHPGVERLQLARDALAKIRNEKSDLRELWEHDPEWVAVVDNLCERLKDVQ